MKTENWVNGMTVYFYGDDIDKWEKICKDAEEGKVLKITIRGIEYELVRHGKWLTEIFEYELEPEKAHYFKCSVCRKWGVVTYNENIQKFKFCAFCGAKMDEDEISNIAKESADKISKALDKVKAKGMQKQNIKEDDEP